MMTTSNVSCERGINASGTTDSLICLGMAAWAFGGASDARPCDHREEPFLSGHVLSFRLRLLQPVRHPHLAVHRRRGGEVFLRLLALARAPIELAEAEVA